jgi:TRAP-type C4-dicarboxylate transport system substrate-binding protein
MNRRPALLVPLVALALLVGGCGGDPPAKHGAAARDLTLSAVANTTNTLTGETLDRFVRDVDAASDGSLSLEQGPALDAGAQDGSADVIGMVREGQADIGVVASRTFDLEGVTSLQALNAPLVVESPSQAAEFLSDPVTAPMLDGLDRAGVVGLALTYDQLRQPLGFDGPLRPDRLAGARVLARPSKASSMVFAAAGASVDPRNGEESEAAIRRGDVLGAETSMDRPSGPQSGSPGHVSAITGNVQLSVKANVIIVNRRVWDGLTDSQQAALRSAAAATRTWAAHQIVPLSTSARAFCDAQLGDVVVADRQELAAWRRAVRPAITALASADPVTGDALDRLREIVRDTPSTDIPTPCTARPPDELPTVQPVGDQSVVAGEWRLSVSARKFAAAGASQQDVALNEGTWTFTFGADGTSRFVEPRGRSCPGTFAVAGHRLSMHEKTEVGDCDGQWELTFRRRGDHMTWTPTPEFLAPYPPGAGFFANPLELVAGPPT